ncbi:MAG: hypothetical protein PHW91_06215 [Bacteroidales bacterium]|nr:hypothetical protein [Bacteroidales bacterium]
MKRLTIILFFIFLVNLCSFGQGLDNLRQRELLLTSDTIAIDSLSIIPDSFVLRTTGGRVISPSFYSINLAKAELIISNQVKEMYDTLISEYRVFPILFEKRFAKRNYMESLSPDSLMGRQTLAGISDGNQESDFGDQIKTQGSISRGIRFGNSQGLSVNSTMNMSFNGDLGKGLMIEGAISDQSIPLQPDGTTHRLEEFDRIHLKVYRDNFAIQAGDIELSTRESTSLLTFKRNVQGLAYDGIFKVNDDTLTVTTALAVPKGKFTRNQIQGIEGNQGPYRLQGNGGEPYIIILSGSERIYIDGTLLQRGEEFHYIIDYNSAELTFTHLMPINRNSRITVEFEYSERSYARFNTFANVGKQTGNWRWDLSVFAEQDSRNQPFDQELTDELKEHLASIGDNEELAFYPQADTVEFDPEKILYQKLDTIVEGRDYTIYKHSTSPEVAIYRVYFSFVGEGKGSYTPEFGSANGRVYRWIAPVNGTQQGSFEPVRRLVTPQKRQMVQAGLSHHWANESSVSGNYALSNTDLNTFSKLDADDNIGHAFQLGFNQNILLGENESKLSFGGSALKTSDGFRSIDRFRPVEFERDWSISQSLNGGNEQMLQLWTSIEQKKKLFAKVEAESFSVADWYSGKRISTSGWNKLSWLNASWNGAMVQSSDTSVNSNFYRGKATLGSNIRFINFSFTGEMETLQSSDALLDSILPQSFDWYQIKSMFSSPDTLKLRGSIAHIYREDYKPFQGAKTLAASSHEVTTTIAGESDMLGSLTGSVGFRRANVNSSIVEPSGNERSTLARIEYANQIIKGFWNIGAGYELSSGLEPNMEYYYIEVPAGQGVYTWVDYNGNGIMELDEFEIANYPDEAKFIRINIPGSKMISVRSNSISLRSNISPSRIIKSKKGIAKQLSRLTNQTAYRAQQKNRYSSFKQYANPLVSNIEDTLITSMSANIRNTVAYNRSSRAFGLEYTYIQGISKTILSNGFEQKEQQSHKLAAWVGLGEFFSIHSEGDRSNTIAHSEYFQFRNYSLDGESIKGSLKFTSSKQHRAEVGTKYNQSANNLNDETLKSMDYFLQADFIFAGKGSLLAKASYIMNTFEGNSQSAVAYEMMKGLQPGRNITWEVTLRQRLSKLFELELGYNGRYLGNGSVVHSGSMMARALF